MAEKQLTGFKVAVLATDGVEQVELLEPKKALEEAGAAVTVIAPKRGEIQGFKHWDRADSIPVGMTLDEADPVDFDAVLLPGGVINSDDLRIEKKAQAFVQEIDAQGRPIAMICHGPWLLVSAGLTRGRSLTSWPTLQDDIRNSGGQWRDRQVLRDKNWVSSRKPDDIPAFNREIISVFSEARQRAKVA
jgi:protease I